MSAFLSLNQVASFIKTSGQQLPIIVEGTPGIGKSAILKMLTEDNDNLLPGYIDCANLDLGDLGIPMIDKDTREMQFALNARFRINEAKRTGKRLVIMLDELGKASKGVINMLLPLFYEHRIGDVELPKGSVVFATSNLRSDGLGDNIPPHGRNRGTTVLCRGPRVEDYLAWSANNGVNEFIQAFVRQEPRCLAIYAEDPDSKSNPYIYNPKNQNTMFFTSPRSLTHAGLILDMQGSVPREVTMAALEGTIGSAAAKDLMQFITTADKMPEYHEVLADPKGCRVPTGVAMFIMALRLATRCELADLDKVLTYIDRWSHAEGRSLFATNLLARKAIMDNYEGSPLLMELGREFVTLRHLG